MEAIGRERGVEPGAIEVWFADEAGVGQKTKIARHWAKRATRPSAPRDQRTASAYIFGAICPKDGKALVLPRCDTEANEPAPGRDRHPDRAGRARRAARRSGRWRLSARLIVPPNITLIPLPAKCPELNPQENVWQFMRDNRLSNHVFRSYDAVVDHCCDAWNKLTNQPWLIMSIGRRKWARRS